MLGSRVTGRLQGLLTLHGARKVVDPTDDGGIVGNPFVGDGEREVLSEGDAKLLGVFGSHVGVRRGGFGFSQEAVMICHFFPRIDTDDAM